MSTFFILGAPAFLAAAILCRRSAAAIPHYFLFFCSSPKELLCRSFSPTKNTKRTCVISTPLPRESSLPRESLRLVLQLKILKNTNSIQQTFFTSIIQSTTIFIIFCSKNNSFFNWIVMNVINFLLNYFVTP